MKRSVLNVMNEEYEKFLSGGKESEVTPSHILANTFVDFMERAFEYGFADWMESDFSGSQFVLINNALKMAHQKNVLGINLLREIFSQLEECIDDGLNSENIVGYATLLKDLSSGLNRYHEYDLRELLGEIVVVLSEYPEIIRKKCKLKTMFGQ